MAFNDLSVSRRRLQGRALLCAPNLDLVGTFVGPEWETRVDSAAF
jgi:hypothetical protein